MSNCRRMLLHAHITPSTLSQLLHYSKVRLLMSQSIQWHWQLTLAEVSWAWGGRIAQYMLTIWWRLDTAIHDWGYYFLHDRKKLGYKGQDNLHNYSLSYFVSLNSHYWVILSLHAAAAEMNKTADFEGLHNYGLLIDLQIFYFYKGSLSLMRHCKQALQEKFYFRYDIWHVAFPFRFLRANFPP